MGLFDSLFGDIVSQKAYNDALSDLSDGAYLERSSVPETLVRKVAEARVYASAANKLENNQTLTMTPIEDGTLCVINAMEALGISNWELTEANRVFGIGTPRYSSLREAAHVAGQKADIAANEAGIHGYTTAREELKNAAAYFMRAEKEY